MDSVSEDQIKKMLEDLDIKYRNTYDDTLLLTSTNAVQNQAVTKKFKELDDKNTRTDNELTNIKSSVNIALSNSKSYTDSKISETKIQIDSKLDNLDSSLNSALTSAKSYTNSEITKVDNKIKSEISRAQASETNLSNRIDGLEEDLTNALNEAKEYTDSEVKNNTNKINTLTGTGEGSVVKTVKDEIAKVVDGAPEQFNTLKEISEYLNSHEDVASGLVESITKLETEKLSVSDIDSSLSTESENPVMNKVITAELSDLSAKVDEEVESLQTQLDSHDILIEDLQENKADKDGVYSGMTVGRSIDLLGVEDVEEGSFLFRPTDGDGSIKDGVAVVKSVKGDSVVWNQCFGNGGTNKDYLKWEGNKATINGEFDADNVSYDIVGSGAKFVAPITNHKYLVEIDVISGTISGGIITHYLPFAHINMDISENQLSVKAFVSSTITPSYYFARTIRAGVIATNLKVMYRVTDLTKMFGVGNEPSTIEEFNARVATLCIEDMNAYNEGEVVNMKASAIKSVGFNAWDEEWEVGKININDGSNVNTTTEIRSKNYSKVLPSTEYYIEKPNTIWIALLEYDADKNYLRNRGGLYGKITTSPDCHYLRFYTSEAYGPTYNHDICINLVHSGYRNGEHEPYVEDVLALPTLDLFPNGMNKIGDVYDEYDSEKSVQRVGIRPYQSGDESIENVLTDGTTTIYVLEEPIVTPHDYRLAYKAWDFGTEQIIADGNTTAITAGITYEFNARDTIRGNKTRLDVLEPIVAGKIDKEADDYYPQLAVGLADNLAGVDVVDSEVNFRRSGGGAISDGVARIEAIKGNSVVWNQGLLNNNTNATINGITITNNGDCSFTLSGTATADAWISPEIANRKYIITGHKWACLGCPSGGSTTTYCLWEESGRIQDTGNGGIATINDTFISIRILIRNGITCNNLVFRPRLIDLTQMFGAGNEPTTIEEFYSRIPMGVDLNAYNEGEVIHMDVHSIESQGVNAWDEEWEEGSLSANTGQNLGVSNRIRTKNYIRVIGGESYSTKLGTIASGESLGIVCYYDDNKKFIETKYPTVEMPFVVPSNARYMRVGFYLSYGSTYKNDICINISDTSINGKYFPYIKRVEDLSIIRKYFPNGMKSAGTAHDEIRYNKATQKWEKVVRIGEDNMWELNWGYSESSAMFYVGSPGKYFRYMGILTTEYPNVEGPDVALKRIFAVTDVLRLYDPSYTDVATFKAMLQEKQVVLYYELAEPIVTELDAEDQFRDLDYQVWNCGTEKAIAEGKSAPLAADITYGFNAIGKIKELESLVAALRAKVGI